MKKYLQLVLCMMTVLLLAFSLASCTGESESGKDNGGETVGGENDGGNGSSGEDDANKPGDGETTEPGDGETTEPGDGETTEPGDGETTEPEPHEHSFNDYVPDGNATCTADGTKTAKCDGCDETDTVDDAGSALGHLYKNWFYDENATCTTNGTESSRCERCREIGFRESVGSAKGHIKTPYEEIEATCTEGGFTGGFYCLTCREELEARETADPLGHSFGEYVSNNDALPGVDGTKTAECSKCGEKSTVTDEGSAIAVTEGLEYALNSDESSYTLIGRGSSEDSRIIIPETYNGLPVTNIGQYAFAEIFGITSVYIPESVTAISDYAFYNCHNLSYLEIGKGVKEIGTDAFLGCYTLLEVINTSEWFTLVKGETKNGYVANYALTLSNWNVDFRNVVFCDDGYIFYAEGDIVYLIGYEGEETDLVLPENYKGKSYSIYPNAFKNRVDITSLVISEGVTEIGKKAFFECNRISKLTVGDNVKTIGNSAFSSCTSLLKVVLGKGVTLIDTSAFSGCVKLLEVENHSSLSLTYKANNHGSVGYYAKNIYNPSDGETKLYSTSNGYVFYASETNAYLIGYIGKEAYLVLPDSFQSLTYAIYERAFQGRSDIKSVTLGSGVTAIDRYAFSGCSGLTSITIPSNVTYIGNEAFSSCRNLIEVRNESGLNITKGSSGNGYVANYALNVYGASDGKSIVETNDDGFVFSDDGINVYLIGYVGSKTDLVLPEKYNGKSYSVKEYAFYGCEDITSLVISSGVEKIGKLAFYGCRSLRSLTVQEGVISIEDSAFRGCYSLTEINIESTVLTALKDYCFADCLRLNRIKYKENIASWKSISKGSDWIYRTGEFSVYCSDGVTGKY